MSLFGALCCEGFGFNLSAALCFASFSCFVTVSMVILVYVGIAGSPFDAYVTSLGLACAWV